MDSYKKGIKIADKYLKKARDEKKRKGYRENLGYENSPKVRDEIGYLDLSYQEKAEIMKYFNDGCDNI